MSPLVVDTRWPVKHVVYVMLENRSLNHMFGAFPGTTDTTKVGVVDGKEARSRRRPSGSRATSRTIVRPP